MPGSREPLHAVITFYDTVNQAVTNREADVLIQKKMVEVGYIHSGWSKERDLLQQNWNKWLEETPLYRPCVDPEIREACLNRIQSRVKHFSTKWRKLGLWTVQEKHFCVVCKVSEGRDRDREESTVIFSPWILQQTQNDDWNGEFTEVCRWNLPGDSSDTINDYVSTHPPCSVLSISVSRSSTRLTITPLVLRYYTHSKLNLR